MVAMHKCYDEKTMDAFCAERSRWEERVELASAPTRAEARAPTKITEKGRRHSSLRGTHPLPPAETADAEAASNTSPRDRQGHEQRHAGTRQKDQTPQRDIQQQGLDAEDRLEERIIINQINAQGFNGCQKGRRYFVGPYGLPAILGGSKALTLKQWYKIDAGFVEEKHRYVFIYEEVVDDKPERLEPDKVAYKRRVRAAWVESDDECGKGSAGAAVLGRGNAIESAVSSLPCRPDVPIQNVVRESISNVGWAGERFNCCAHLPGGRRYTLHELMALRPHRFNKRSPMWDDMLKQIPTKTRSLPVESVLKNRPTVETMNEQTADGGTARSNATNAQVVWSLEFCRFPWLMDFDSRYPNAQAMKIQIQEEIIDEKVDVPRYRFPRTLIIGSTNKVLEIARCRVAKIVDNAHRRHPASRLDAEGIIEIIWDQPSAAHIQKKISAFQTGQTQVVICFSRYAAHFIDHDVCQVFLTNLKKGEAGYLEAVVYRLCSFRPPRSVNVTVILDVEDEEMASWLRRVLEIGDAVMLTPLKAIDYHLALLRPW